MLSWKLDLTDKKSKVPLQVLLNHTASRILSITLTDESLIYGKTWLLFQNGDAMAFSSSCGHNGDDSSLYLTTLVPIRLIDTDNSLFVSENLRSSSRHFCRPVKFVFCKDTPERIKLEIERIQSEIASQIFTESNEVKIEHQLYMIMIYGKTINVTDISSHPCFAMCVVQRQQWLASWSELTQELLMQNITDLEYLLSATK